MLFRSQKMRTASFRSLVLASAIALTTAATAMADTAWTPASTTSPGSARAGSRDVPVQAGDETVIAIQGLPVGASVTVLHGVDLLTAEPLTAGEDGKVSVPVTIPADASSVCLNSASAFARSDSASAATAAIAAAFAASQSIFA